MNKKLLFYLKILTGIIILLFLIFKVGINDIFFTFQKIKIQYVFIVILLYFLILFIGALNIHILIRPYKKNIPLMKLFKYYILVFSLGLFFPGRMGDISLIYFLKKEKIDIGAGSAVFILDKFITLSLFSILSILGFFIFFSKPQILQLTAFLLLLIFITVFMIFTNKGRSIIKKYILRGYSKKFRGFSKAVNNYLKKHRADILLNYALTLIKTALEGLILYLLLLSFGFKVDILMLMIIRAIMVIVSLIPITLSGIGVKESIGAFLLAKLGIEAAIGTTIFILLLILNYLLGGLFIILLLKKEDINFKKF